MGIWDQTGLDYSPENKTITEKLIEKRAIWRSDRVVCLCRTTA